MHTAIFVLRAVEIQNQAIWKTTLGAAEAYRKNHPSSVSSKAPVSSRSVNTFPHAQEWKGM